MAAAAHTYTSRSDSTTGSYFTSNTMSSPSYTAPPPSMEYLISMLRSLEMRLEDTEQRLALPPPPPPPRPEPDPPYGLPYSWQAAAWDSPAPRLLSDSFGARRPWDHQHQRHTIVPPSLATSPQPQHHSATSWDHPASRGIPDWPSARSSWENPASRVVQPHPAAAPAGLNAANRPHTSWDLPVPRFSPDVAIVHPPSNSCTFAMPQPSSWDAPPSSWDAPARCFSWDSPPPPEPYYGMSQPPHWAEPDPSYGMPSSWQLPPPPPPPVADPFQWPPFPPRLPSGVQPYLPDCLTAEREVLHSPFRVIEENHMNLEEKTLCDTHAAAEEYVAASAPEQQQIKLQRMLSEVIHEERGESVGNKNIEVFDVEAEVTPVFDGIAVVAWPDKTVALSHYVLHWSIGAMLPVLRRFSGNNADGLAASDSEDGLVLIANSFTSFGNYRALSVWGHHFVCVFDPGGDMSSRFSPCFTSSRCELFVATWYPP